ncbi:hypothetical protein AJ79_04638 [Helicocarpus griseus UAMH5409]|uniref:Protein kinase domain-containing protein n=1 Tax=Helicocarpus griseus UAMH5409 TaxID=1447875 RepID=A0A2B7XSU6_9EURO|nr:hypothetical protein AJ79_04638 [Helicocarpus griseus UAMH5409]
MSTFFFGWDSFLKVRRDSIDSVKSSRKPLGLRHVKPDNVLVNYGRGDIRFTDVQLADMGSTVPADSAYAKDGDMIGAPVWRSPEAHLQIGWGTPTDIWSFGALCQFFGPFPETYQEIAGPETLAISMYIHQSLPPENRKPFTRISKKEVSTEDRDFILKITKLDPRDRPTAKELLKDEWFRAGEEGEEARS